MKIVWLNALLAAICVGAATAVIAGSLATNGAPRPRAERPSAEAHERAPAPSPGAALEEWTCAGVITAPMIRTVVERHASELAACRAPEGDPRELLVYVRVDAEGGASLARAVGPHATDTRECVLSAAATWGFPPPLDGDCAVVRLPLVL